MIKIFDFFKRKPKSHIQKMEARLAKLKRIKASPSLIKFTEDWIAEEKKDARATAAPNKTEDLNRQQRPQTIKPKRTGARSID